MKLPIKLRVPILIIRLYRHLGGVAEKTFLGLGEEQALFFIKIANDWLDIQAVISKVYPKEETINSLIHSFFVSLFKDIYWMQALFLTGNYALIHRNLRFIWEMIYRGYYVDTLSKQSGIELTPPGPTLDEKVSWLGLHEKKMFSWENFIKSQLLEMLPQSWGEEVENHYYSVWNALNEYVHPSKKLFDRIMSYEPATLVTDVYNKDWAIETREISTQVFDLIWVAIITCFPNCSSLVAEKGLSWDYPITSPALKAI